MEKVIYLTSSTPGSRSFLHVSIDHLKNFHRLTNNLSILVFWVTILFTCTHLLHQFHTDRCGPGMMQYKSIAAAPSILPGLIRNPKGMMQYKVWNYLLSIQTVYVFLPLDTSLGYISQRQNWEKWYYTSWDHFLALSYYFVCLSL